MSNRESKRSSICRAEIIACAECDVIFIPGNSNISVSGVWEKLKFSSVEFSEKPTSDSSSYDVSIDFSFSDTSHDYYIHLMTWCNIYVLIKLVYSDGSVKVVGSSDFPIILKLNNEGTPAKFHLTYSGQQPEPSKYL